MNDQPILENLPTDQSPVENSTLDQSTNQVSPDQISSAVKVKKTKSFWLDALETLAIAFAIFFVIYNFLAQPHLVKGESMMPNYKDGEYILTSKVYNWLGTPERGDVIVLRSPDDKSVQFIKRIIGLSGEKIKISNNQIMIYNAAHPNGFALHESYINSQVSTAGRTFIPEGETITIPANDYIVMGDNRDYSYDSRTWGFLNKKDIIGKAFFIYWPIPDFGLVAHATYK